MRWQFAALWALDPSELYAALALRQAVFVVEQACAYQDADGQDARAWHLLGWAGERLAAYARLFEPDAAGEAAIGRVIVAPDRRGEGLGRALMLEAMRQSQARWPAPIHLSAQAHLRGFYEALGFVVCGPGYDEDGIPHLPMRCDAAGRRRIEAPTHQEDA